MEFYFFFFFLVKANKGVGGENRGFSVTHVLY
jgi:hypothetical protein